MTTRNRRRDPRIERLIEAGAPVEDTHCSECGNVLDLRREGGVCSDCIDDYNAQGNDDEGGWEAGPSGVGTRCGST